MSLITLVVTGLSVGYGLAYVASSQLGFLGGSTSAELDEAITTLARAPGPARSLATATAPADLSYLQQFCPPDPDPAAPGLCTLEEEQLTLLAEHIPVEAVDCWQQIYDYAFGPLADQVYLAPPLPTPDDPVDPTTPEEEVFDCNQGVITVLVQPDFISQIEADSHDRARFQDIIFIMAAVIEYEGIRLEVPPNWSNLAGMVFLSYYQGVNINAPGTWNAQPATAGAVLTLSENPSGPGDIGVDPETRQLPLPTTGRWGDADQIGDPHLLMIFHRADCTDGGESPVALGGLHRYVVVYRQTEVDGFSCHAF